MYKDRRDREEDPIKERLIHVNRVAKVVKGGRRFSFSALVVVGDGGGQVGLGFGKANEVSEAIRKGIQDGKNNMFAVPMKGTTIPYQITAELGAARVLLKPARPGTGIIAGGAVRAIVERAGIKDIVTKNLGTKNQINSARCTIEGLRMLKTSEQFAELKKTTSKKKDPRDRSEGDDDIEVINEDDPTGAGARRGGGDRRKKRDAAPRAAKAPEAAVAAPAAETAAPSNEQGSEA